MGYEIKLIIGKSGYPSREVKHKEQAELDGNLAWFPMEKDEAGNVIHTGRTEVYFQVYGIVELCCPGHDSNILQLDRENKEPETICWFFYGPDGNTEIRGEDMYGDPFKPVPVADVITALEKDAAESHYRRFKWALGFLYAMPKDAEVILYGH